eukprot:scaffold3416_cov185-Amphora_coffeaeformis.AAC.7
MPSTIRIGSKVSGAVGPLFPLGPESSQDPEKRARRHRERYHGVVLSSVDERTWGILWDETGTDDHSSSDDDNILDDTGDENDPDKEEEEDICLERTDDTAEYNLNDGAFDKQEDHIWQVMKYQEEKKALIGSSVKVGPRSGPFSTWTVRNDVMQDDVPKQSKNKSTKK